MSLKEINLPTHLVAQLYTRSLVIPDQGNVTNDLKSDTGAAPIRQKSEDANLIMEEPKGEKYLGNHKKKVMIGVNYPDHVYLPDEDLQFLTKILGACKLGLEDVAIVNMATKESKKIMKELNSSSVILFDILPETIGIPAAFPAFQVQKLQQTNYVHAPGLSAISSEKDIKNKLWTALKKVFDI